MADTDSTDNGTFREPRASHQTKQGRMLLIQQMRAEADRLSTTQQRSLSFVLEDAANDLEWLWNAYKNLVQSAYRK